MKLPKILFPHFSLYYTSGKNEEKIGQAKTYKGHICNIGPLVTGRPKTGQCFIHNIMIIIINLSWV